ncbi:fimbria/pilus outer membrane usher protein, partial [Klebsiella pneumoniae]|uniref:fimbria/pilus outer membrane usher protein n=1 Tax=Klebsiella pneumoniae TaxID=573 RepID=UPI0015FD4453
VTQASTHLQDRNENGQSFRIAYSKFLDATATNFTLAAYRYSTKGYYSFNDAIYTHQGYRERDKRFHDYWNDRDDDELAPLDLNTWDAVRAARPRNTFNLTLNQRLADGWGTLYFSGTQPDYWSDTN